MYQTLYSFDFDDTLIHTMLPDPGMFIWEKKTKTKWPYRGWWSKIETLDMSIFDTPKNEWTYKKYLDAKDDPTGYLILATGRLDTVTGMREAVMKILNHYELKFDEVYLNPGGDTYNFKTMLFERLIAKTGCKHFIMYDDRADHLYGQNKPEQNFHEWAQNQICTVTVVDVVNKTTKTFQPKNI
jgi:hypothetical protein